MATSRGEKSTIPQNKDPLAGVNYSQPNPHPPIDSLISDTTKEAKAEAAPETGKKADVKSEESSPSPSQQKGKVTVSFRMTSLKGFETLHGGNAKRLRPSPRMAFVSWSRGLSGSTEAPSSRERRT